MNTHTTQNNNQSNELKYTKHIQTLLKSKTKQQTQTKHDKTKQNKSTTI